MDVAENIVEPAAAPVEGETGDNTDVVEGAEPSEQIGDKEAEVKGESPDTDNASGEPDNVSKAKEHTPPGYQKRIDKITREKERLAEENAYLKGLAEGSKVASPTEEIAELVKPDRDDYEDYEDYIEALTDYKTDKKLAEKDAIDAKKANEVTAEKELNKRQENFQSQIAAAKVKYPDFEEMVMENNDLAITGDMLRVMQESTLGADIAYHLARNPEEAVKIAGLSPTAQAMALGRIEYTLDTPPQKTTEPRNVTKAPEPVGRDIKGKGTVLTTLSDKDSFEEWERKRNRQRGR